MYKVYKEFFSTESAIPTAIKKMVTYKKYETTIIAKGRIESDITVFSYQPEQVTLKLQTADQEVFEYVTVRDGINYYQLGDQVNLYRDTKTSKQYIFDYDQQTDILIQLAVIQLVLYSIGKMSTSLKGRYGSLIIVGVQYILRLPTFTCLMLLLIYLNIDLANRVENGDRIPIYLVTFFGSILYIVFIIKLYLYISEAKKDK
ncbi:hypothetical protein NWE55_06640 [Myroides albus]|uniref:Uncharacterized protein n=2 Tax=Myroides TaxID=76831 RepID=A0A6I3LJL7_9FLAO|nr:hypothetical protein [Myroides albus]MTG96671.1 hypothetical protein [Myroides albus]MVX34746.1 hypothetical protein [Myroides sp. LoEW2-1]UVD80917.1 hypothetical protein NWE55_06640 [Myroides albus]